MIPFIKNEIHWILKKTKNLAWTDRKTILLWLLSLVIVSWLLFPMDYQGLAFVQEWTPRNSGELLARFFSQYGDFIPYNGTLFLGCFLMGSYQKKISLKRIAFYSLLAAILAGAFANVIRIGTGRARPSASIEMVTKHTPTFRVLNWMDPSQDSVSFFGLCKSYNFHSFPSGHTATSFSAVGFFTVIAPPAGIATGVLALLVGWSRMDLNRHFPSDIVTGALIGIGIGGFVGKLYRKRTPKTKRARSNVPSSVMTRVSEDSILIQ
jgi:membrane-associated phospholipid phosphatase